METSYFKRSKPSRVSSPAKGYTADREVNSTIFFIVKELPTGKQTGCPKNCLLFKIYYTKSIKSFFKLYPFQYLTTKNEQNGNGIQNMSYDVNESVVETQIKLKKFFFANSYFPRSKPRHKTFSLIREKKYLNRLRHVLQNIKHLTLHVILHCCCYELKSVPQTLLYMIGETFC